MHRKAIPDGVLLVSVCSSLDLLAFVSGNFRVYLYRCTTMSLLWVTDPLLPREYPSSYYRSLHTSPSGPSSAQGWSVSWCDKTNVFVVSLPNGDVHLLDLTTSRCVRVLTPNKAETAPSVSGGSEGDQEEETEKEDDEELNEKKSKNNLRLPASLVEALDATDEPIPLSTHPKTPLLSVHWTRLPSPHASHRYFHHPLPSLSKTLPLPANSFLRAHLYEELFSHSSTAPADMLSLSYLFLLDAQGGLSVVLGGLYEVFYVQCTLPGVRALSSSTSLLSSWDNIRVREMLVVSYSGSGGLGLLQDTAASEPAPAPSPSNLFLDTQALFAALDAPSPHAEGQADDSGLSYSVVLVVQPLLSQSTIASQECIIEIPLGNKEAVGPHQMFSPHTVALCFVKEYHRTAQRCFTVLVKRYFESYEALMYRLWLHPSQSRFSGYYREGEECRQVQRCAASILKGYFVNVNDDSIVRSYLLALGLCSEEEDSDDPFMMGDSFSKKCKALMKAEKEFNKACTYLVRFLPLVSYPCYEAAQVLVNASLSLSVVPPSSSRADPHSTSLLSLLSALRTRTEYLVRHVQQERQLIMDLLQWLTSMVPVFSTAPVLPSLLRDLSLSVGYGASGEEGGGDTTLGTASFELGLPSSVPLTITEEPLPASRWPSLLRFLQRMEKEYLQSSSMRWLNPAYLDPQEGPPWGISPRLDALRLLTTETSAHAWDWASRFCLPSANHPTTTAGGPRTWMNQTSVVPLQEQFLLHLENALRERLGHRKEERRPPKGPPGTTVKAVVVEQTEGAQTLLLSLVTTPERTHSFVVQHHPIDNEDEEMPPSGSPLLFHALLLFNDARAVRIGMQLLLPPSVRPSHSVSRTDTGTAGSSSSLALTWQALTLGVPPMWIDSIGAAIVEKLKKSAVLSAAQHVPSLRSFCPLSAERYALVWTSRASETDSAVQLIVVLIDREGKVLEIQNAEKMTEDGEDEEEEAHTGDSEAIFVVACDVVFNSNPLLVSHSIEKDLGAICCGNKLIVLDLYDYR